MKLLYKKEKEGHKIFLFSVMVLTVGCATQEIVTSQQSNQPVIKNIDGEYIYERNCTPCHGSDGTGALAGVPDLTQLKGFSPEAHSDAALFEHIKHVKQGIKTSGSPISMPPKLRAANI